MTASEQPAPPTAAPTPPGRMLANAGLVLVGGAIGAALRHLVVGLFPLRGELGLMVVNITGAFALAWLAAWALRDAGRREPWRLLLGTGLCGGYTSYSGILLAVPSLLAPVQLLWLPSALATVVLGLVASAAGWWLGMRGAAARGAGRDVRDAEPAAPPPPGTAHDAEDAGPDPRAADAETRGAAPGAPVDDASEAAGADGSGADGSGADRADAEEPR